MGNVQVQYREARGTKPAGSEITDPVEWFDELFGHKYRDMCTLFNGADQATKDQILEVFDGENVFRNHSSATMWYDRVREEPDDLA